MSIITGKATNKDAFEKTAEQFTKASGFLVKRRGGACKGIGLVTNGTLSSQTEIPRIPKRNFPKFFVNGKVLLLQKIISFLSWRRLQPIWGAIFTEIKVFNHENILPAYTVDEFESQFRMTRGTFELLCRAEQATGRVPQQHAIERPPIPLDKQVLAFVWFIANSEVIRLV